jgi:hypothetical protein
VKNGINIGKVLPKMLVTDGQRFDACRISATAPKSLAVVVNKKYFLQ